MSMRGPVAKSGANLRRRTIRRRVIALGVAGVTIAGAQIGVSMLGDTGTVDASVTQNTSAVSKHIYATSLPTGTAGTPPGVWAAGFVNTNNATNASPTVARVAWSAAPSTTGTVTTAGDVAVIDATAAGLPANATGVSITMYISNLNNFARNYSSFALPVGVYQWSGTAWSQSTNTDFYSGTNKNALYISDSDGSVTLNLPKAAGSAGYYEIVIDKTNGFWQSNSSLPATNDLGPSFYMTATVY
jgi:hypothetical protein